VSVSTIFKQIIINWPEAKKQSYSVKKKDGGDTNSRRINSMGEMKPKITKHERVAKNVSKPIPQTPSILFNALLERES
jgi:hypothetical protein